MTAYYNEIDPYAAQWLRNLIAAGHIAPGDVDERSIVDVRADDLRGYTQCHFFAGIAGWSIALRLAGWPDDRPVWTGSCPCQPFSAAGKGEAFNDERHLWPAWLPLIAQCRPPTIFGEQVEAAVGWGWLDTVFADLEQEGYAVGAAVLPACSVGAPHIRQRLWFVADATERDQWGHGGISRDAAISRSGETRKANGDSSRGTSAMGGTDNAARRRDLRPDITERILQQPVSGSSPDFWDCDWLPCTDGKARPVEPGSFPLAHGIPARPSKLRAFGNAIVPHLAAQFIRACS